MKFILLAIFIILLAKDFSSSVKFVGHHTSIYDLCAYENIASSISNNYFITITDYFNQDKISDFYFGVKKNESSRESENLNKYSVEITNSDIPKYFKYFIKTYGLTPLSDIFFSNSIVCTQKENESFYIDSLPPAFIDKLRL